jgi:hypothetical protein
MASPAIDIYIGKDRPKITNWVIRSTREWWGTDLLVLGKRRAVDDDL